MRVRALRARLTLTRQVALLSLVPIVVLGFVLARVLQTQIVARTLADEGQAAELIVRIGIQPRLTRKGLRDGLSAAGIRDLDRQLRTRWVKEHLARIKIWSAADTIVYSDDHSLIGRKLQPSDDLERALDGNPDPARIVNPKPHTETAGEVGLGTLVEVYVPLRFDGDAHPAGAFEMYLSYRPIAGAIEKDKTTVAVLVSVGLALLWLVLYPIVARASRRLRLQAKENYRLARYDQLTGLPNRRLFTESLGAWLSSAGRVPEDAGVLVVDLDGFKQINDTLGDETGDQVLCAIADRLSGLGKDALVARLGSDEFAVLCDRRLEVAGVSGVRELLEAPITLQGIALNVEVSIGLVTIEDGGQPPHELLRHAEVALARARSIGSRLEVYSPQVDRFDPRQLILLGEVRGALERHELVIFYQPKLELSTGRIFGVEALVRWQHPRHGLLGPMEFVPLVEPTALVDPMTLYVMEEAARQQAAWKKAGLDLEISVNLSVRNLLDLELPAKLTEILRRHRVGAEQVTVEVTESATMTDSSRAIGVLEALREMGVGISIDDFGTGNASIQYLAKLPASEIKIDRSFIAGVCEDPRAEAIVRSTVDLARHFRLRVVAEGVETGEVLERLAALGCDAGQGYLISRPLPAEELTAKLSSERTAASR
jgi:diguanylate cyclase (GGDEF)-like protein